MYVIGTAGHVDHGKSTLVQALTGIDPDRLAEEKSREMTIDLGFAWLTLADTEVGVVDVPGHRDFIENMLAGVGGIDLALLVVAADEGVMPQTREHLAILDLLAVRGGVVAVTKVDLIDDPDWLELVTLDVNEALAGTILADAPILPVSARTGQGLDALRQTLWDHLSAAPPRPDNGRPRLPVDRIFTLSGFGTVVTGTLVDGRFRIGDTVEILPAGHKARIRGLQTHKTKLDAAQPGSRVAINLSGIERDDLQRGDVIAAPDSLGHTILFDAAYRHLVDADAPLKHNMEVKLFVGAAELVARTRVIGSEQIDPGEDGWLQLATQTPVALARGDRFILRRPSPSPTLGGGRVLDPHPGRRHRRFRPDVIARMQTLAQGTPAELLLQRLRRLEPTSPQQLLQQAGLDEAVAQAALASLEAAGDLIRIEQQLLSRAFWEQIQDKAVAQTAVYHQENRLRLGMPREELRSRLQLKPPLFNALMAQLINEARLVDENGIVRQPAHTIQFSPAQQQAIANLEARMQREGVNSPSVKMCKTAVGEDVYMALLDLGRLQQINADVVYDRESYAAVRAQLVNFLQENGRINAAQARDLLHTSRKYAIALLEHFDDIKLTRRIGDDRELVSR